MLTSTAISIFYAGFGGFAQIIAPNWNELVGSSSKAILPRSLWREAGARIFVAVVMDIAFCYSHGAPDPFWALFIGAGSINFVNSMTKH